MYSATVGLASLMTEILDLEEMAHLDPLRREIWKLVVATSFRVRLVSVRTTRKAGVIKCTLNKNNRGKLPPHKQKRRYKILTSSRTSGEPEVDYSRPLLYEYQRHAATVALANKLEYQSPLYHMSFGFVILCNGLVGRAPPRPPSLNGANARPWQSKAYAKARACLMDGHSEKVLIPANEPIQVATTMSMVSDTLRHISCRSSPMVLVVFLDSLTLLAPAERERLVCWNVHRALRISRTDNADPELYSVVLLAAPDDENADPNFVAFDPIGHTQAMGVDWVVLDRAG